MSRSRRARHLALLAAAIVGGPAACRDAAAPPTTRQSELPDSADQMIFGMRQTLTAGNIRRADVHADTALLFDQGLRAELRHVNTVFFTRDGAKNGTMVARRGTLDQRTQIFDARGDVVATSEDGRKLTSPHVTYDRGTNQISSDTSFVFTQPRGTLSGIGFRSDPQLRNVTVLKNASGRTKLSGAPSPRSPRR